MLLLVRYKERLHAKYTKPINSKDWKPRLSSSSWTFIKDGLDDFRDGKPPLINNGDVLIKVGEVNIDTLHL